MTEDIDHFIARLQTAIRDRMQSDQRPPRRRWPFRVAAGLIVAGVIGVAVGLRSGGTASTAEPVAATTTQPTTEVPTTVPETTEVPTTVPETTEVPTTVPETTEVPTTVPETTEAPTTVPPTTLPPTTTSPPTPPTTTPLPPSSAPTISITCPNPMSSAADSFGADFGYDFHATTAALVRWGIEYGDGRSYIADDEAKARTQVFWHQYSSPGTYTVTAWVEDAIGRRASDTCRFTWS